MNARGGGDARAARLSLSRVSRSAGADSDGEDRRVLVLDLGGDVDEASRRAVTALVAKDIAAAGLSVLSGDDLRNMADLESQRQDAGCSSDESCLVEIADAMNARLVVSGFVGRLGKLLVVNLSLFDARSAQAHGRATVEADSLEELPRKLEPAVRELVDDFRPQTRVGTGVFAAVGGGAGAAVGVGLVVVGGLMALQHADKRSALLETSASFEASQDQDLITELARQHDDVEGARVLYNQVGVPLLWTGGVLAAVGVGAVVGGVVMNVRAEDVE